MKKMVPLNVTSEGLAPTLTAVYYKKGTYNFLKEKCLEWGAHMEHAEIAVLEIYEEDSSIRDIEDA